MSSSKSSTSWNKNKNTKDTQPTVSSPLTKAPLQSSSTSSHPMSSSIFSDPSGSTGMDIDNPSPSLASSSARSPSVSSSLSIQTSSPLPTFTRPTRYPSSSTSSVSPTRSISSATSNITPIRFPQTLEAKSSIRFTEEFSEKRGGSSGTSRGRGRERISNEDRVREVEEAQRGRTRWPEFVYEEYEKLEKEFWDQERDDSKHKK